MLLSEKNKHPLDKRIKFQDEGHRYWIDGDDKDLTSSTTYIHTFFNHFDADKVIKGILKSAKYKDPSYEYYGMSHSHIKNKWETSGKDASGKGTKMHKDIEDFYNGVNIKNDSPEFKYFLDFYKDHKHLKIFRTEWLIFSEIHRITGSIDAVYENEDGTLTLGDWKRSKEIKFEGYNNQCGKKPFANLQDCNYMHYSLQLNLYRNILETFYGKKIKEMFLVVLHPDNDSYKKIIVNRMEREGDLLFTYRKKQLATLGYEITFDKKDLADFKEDDEIDDDDFCNLKPLLKLDVKPQKSNIEVDNKGFSKKQAQAYNIMKNERNIFLTGAAGCGKTFLIKRFCSDYKNSMKIAVTSTTGSSAILIGGVTLHSYLGIGLGKLDIDNLYLLLANKPFHLKRWRELDVLIIDEVSMLSIELFEKLEHLARLIRKNSKLFGGIQLVLSGDYLQLPCVDNPKVFCFESEIWKKCIEYTVYLDENFRQDDCKLQKCLNKIRFGELDDETMEILTSRVDIELKNEHGIKPTKIYSLNKDVDRENQMELHKLFKKNTNLEFYEYELEYEILKNNTNVQFLEEKLKKNCNFPYNLQLCIGAQVMLLINLDFENELVNGSRGVVVDFKDDIPVVKFLNGVISIIDYKVQTIEECGQPIAAIKQIPLRVSFAITIHKSQGVTLDYAEIDLGEVFEAGQAYVALSRIKKLEGLTIKNLNKTSIFANNTAVKFYKNLK